MAVQLNHTIVPARDKAASADFLADLLGLPAPEPFGPFVTLQVDNDVTLDFAEAGDDLPVEHYAFLIGDDEFDTIFGRIKDRQLPYWADPGHQEPNEINTRDGGRGVYFEDPNGHNLEILTAPTAAAGDPIGAPTTSD